MVFTHSSGGHSGGGHSSGGHSGGGHSSSHSYGHAPYTQHLVRTNVISSYLIWELFSGAVYHDFERYEEYYNYSLYYYDTNDKCLYYKRIENNNNKTEIDGSELIIITNKDENITSKIYKEERYKYHTFCKKEDDNIFGNILIFVFILCMIAICCCTNDNLNRNMY